MPKKLRELKRTKQVIGTLLKYELEFIFSAIGFNKKISNIDEPEVIRRVFEDLGGSFVKLGQLLSLRPDLIPVKYCEELSKLQDSVKPFSYVSAKKIIEAETGQKSISLFSSIEKKPVASASIGQVYLGKLKNGAYVAVKVQRPGITQIMETDIGIMEFLASKINVGIFKDMIDPKVIVSEFKQYTQNELNYLSELESIDSFYERFKETTLKIPRSMKELSTKKVLFMEYVDGVPLKLFIESRADRALRKRLCDEIVNAFFKQIFIDGYFHADPHPGNILVLNQDYYPGKTIALLDFGITGKINTDIKKSLLSLFSGLIDKDLDIIVKSMAELHLIKSENPALRNDLKEMLSPYYGVSLNKIDLPKLFLQTIKVARKNNIVVPRDYVLLGKCIITLESTCSNIYPEFNFVESAKPFLVKMAINEHTPSHALKKGLRRIRNLKALVEEVPLYVKQYFDASKSQSEEIKELSEHLLNVEKQIYRSNERFMLLLIEAILLLAGYFLKEYPPFFDGVSFFSLAAYLMAIAVFVLLIKSFVKK